LALDEFGFHIFQIRVIELELPLEGAIGQAPPALEHRYRLVEDLLKGHSPLALQMRHAEDGVRIGDIARMHVYHTWLTKKSQKCWSV
jgi:hypothetical protein